MSALHSLQTAAVSIRSVRKVYGDPDSGPVALKSVDLDIRDNEFFTLLGPSGCGKTTLLRMIAGFEFPTAGEILLYGENIANRAPYDRPVNTVFQHYALFPHMTIAENLAFGLESHPMGQRLGKAAVAERVREMLALVQMERFAERRPTQLSGGQQQRVALARALAPHPKVLLLDEPLSALDLKLRQAMREELKTIQAKTGITFIFVTHDQEEALTMSDRIAVLANGEVQQVGRPTDIYEQPRNRFVADFIGETNFLPAQVAELAGEQALFRIPGGQALRAAGREGLREGAEVTLSIRPERLRLVGADTPDATPCTLAEQVYLGTDLQYQVQLADGTRLRVRTPNSAGQSQRFAAGERLGLQFDRDSASVLLD
ncbi:MULTISPECIES: ABC transporter ATP-binding protein [unclassified Pseudomonas]|uniref:ABC transporter ATP-binding protein n=1 Tax=Pseudomonas TaxID=286 RepID=UPI0002A459F4|nr:MULTISPECIES: ABC transporter ATP-binding protein [unclassified Pseudomonas]MBB1608100.1 spermidine/putrescine ABC transporter ATP-binding protein [Pseudomonas sp. UMC76]MBB1637153.1 spermidine/putrescine ABC transporter ATP-binding protein [Pseudomonas sp. UME83]NTX90829.1 ABC transporter ATP-binding protein [Pseudomonas sp. UMA643]NTY20250.1 ABC transporter ATP-binding protein [Pseudomonas sp. UMC3103]NTY26765.1 ABC transporter ATP-binding protein [Pseudomonas sp. UMA603]